MKQPIALIFAASTMLLAGCCTTHHAAKWEYKEVLTLSAVNELAKTGWSVVAVEPSAGNPPTYLMKRKVP